MDWETEAALLRQPWHASGACGLLHMFGSFNKLFIGFQYILQGLCVCVGSLLLGDDGADSGLRVIYAQSL